MSRCWIVLLFMAAPGFGNTTYFVDPANGSDANAGRRADKPWKSLYKVNALKLGPGDKVVIAPGVLHETLQPNADGTKVDPAIIQFSPGRHEFRADLAVKLSYFISNSADAPERLRPIGILVKNARHLRLVGGKDCDIWFGDRMTELINDHSEDIMYVGLNFDMVRPTVSEFRVLEANGSSFVVQVAEGSTYAIEKGRFAWTGDLGPGWTMVQEAIPGAGKCWRLGKWDPLSRAHAEDLGGARIRFTFKRGENGMAKGEQFQFRNVERDTTSAVNTRCRDIVFRDCNFYALPGMGIVSQFTENITFERVNVVPRPGTLRTCAAWADCFHFSGCRGEVLVDSCSFSGTQDDPINVHGTHLRLIKKVAPNQVLIRFMHPQTYGFAAFQPGDEVDFVNHINLRSYATVKVKAIERETDKDWLLTTVEAVPRFAQDDVVDNISWHPNLTIRNCKVMLDSCRGFLITTPGKVLVENNTFYRTAMSAIDIADDANSWFESGPVRDVTVRKNKFIQCGGPVIRIIPENRTAKPDEPVHANIRIYDNFFDLASGAAIAARSVKGFTITGNRFTTKAVPVEQQACTDVVIEKNETGVGRLPGDR